jgi:hypothetical protein
LYFLKFFLEVFSNAFFSKNSMYLYF